MDSERSHREQQLLDRFLAGDIDKSTYDEMLARIQTLSDSGDGSNMRNSLDGRETYSGSDRETPAETPPPNPPGADDLDMRATVGYTPVRIEPGVELGHFRIVEQLGRGGMGEVWKADDLVSPRHVVIKLLPAELKHHTVEMERLRQSFQTIHELHHEHICPVYLLGDDDRFGCYMVMQFIDGIDLLTYRRRFVESNGSFSPEEVVRVLRPVAEALDYSHRRQVVHRDIKPENIMLGEDGSDVQVVDFGLAAEIRTSMSRVSQTGLDTSGTRPYMSPEQWKGALQDGLTDQYSLGVVAYELLCGRLPFETADHFILRSCVLEDPAPVLEDFSQELNDVLARAMAKERNDRFTLCADFISAFERATVDSPDTIIIESSGKEDSGDAPAHVRESGESGTIDKEGDSYTLDRPEANDSGSDEKPHEREIAPFDEAVIEHHFDQAYQSLCQKGNSKFYTRQHVETCLNEWINAAEWGHPKAQWLVADCYLEGVGVQTNESVAFEWVQKAAQQELPLAEKTLGSFYLTGRGVEEDEDAAAYWFQRSAEHGELLGVVSLGTCYRKGYCFDKDPQKAFELFREAADQGSALGVIRVGDCYLSGEGVTQNLHEAVRWYRRAAQQENAVAQLRLGKCYYTGEGVPQDYAQAVEWFTKAAENDNAPAQVNLGHCYAHGLGVAKNLPQAVHWYALAAEEDSPTAQTWLANCYERGVGVKQNLTEAINWYHRAAEKADDKRYDEADGVTRSVLKLAEFCEQGRGMPRHLELAKHYYETAAHRGSEAALAALKRFNRKNPLNWFRQK